MIIAMWSGPRNLSTAMMRSFGARADCAVMDEPFFAPFLEESGKDHPGRDETLAAHETDPDKVAALCAAPTGQTYSFQKHMPHHMLPGFPMGWAAKAKSFFLIRHPQRVIASYVKGRAAFDLEDLGFAPQRRLWDKLGRPPVIHSETILTDPARALAALCAAIEIPFDPHMLSWAAGPREEDGAWAPYWYANVQRSTGFGDAPKDMPPIAPEYSVMLSACLPDYQALASQSIKV
jgi:hypothetical protein